jgi:hypothetical protein
MQNKRVLKHKVKMDTSGNITILDFPETTSEPKLTFLETIYTPKPVVPLIDTSFVDELEASMDDNFVNPNRYDYFNYQ